METMVEFDEIGGPECLHLVHRDVEPPSAGEVQVAMRAAGLNRAELMYLAGQYLTEPALPSKIGVEGSGIVTAVGDDDSPHQVGDPVCIMPNMPMNRYGVMGTRVNVPSSAVVPKPTNVSFIDAASFWMAYPTAYGGMVQAGGLRDGASQVVLISAASSSVGIAAIQIAKSHGATVIATTRGRSKVELIQSIGPDHVIVTDEVDLADEVMRLTDGRGFDIAFDAVAGPFIETLAKAAGREATLVEYGVLSGEPGTLPLFAMLGKGLTLRSFHVGFDLMAYPERMKAATEHLLQGLSDGRYRPVIDSTFPLEDVAAAYRRLASNQQFGKVVVELRQSNDSALD